MLIYNNSIRIGLQITMYELMNQPYFSFSLIKQATNCNERNYMDAGSLSWFDLSLTGNCCGNITNMVCFLLVKILVGKVEEHQPAETNSSVLCFNHSWSIYYIIINLLSQSHSSCYNQFSLDYWLLFLFLMSFLCHMPKTSFCWAKNKTGGQDKFQFCGLIVTYKNTSFK